MPPLSLFDTPPLEHAKIDEEALKRNASLLEQKLADFGVEGKVVEVQPGPVVTMFKFEPASGVKVSQIVNLSDDLSMALKALAIRIQAPVPGEAVVGIEVPNRQREKVYLREILESEEFAAAQSHLTIALGKDISGKAGGGRPGADAASADRRSDRHRQVGLDSHHDRVGAVQCHRR